MIKVSQTDIVTITVLLARRLKLNYTTIIVETLFVRSAQSILMTLIDTERLSNNRKNVTRHPEIFAMVLVY